MRLNGVDKGSDGLTFKAEQVMAMVRLHVDIKTGIMRAAAASLRVAQYDVISQRACAAAPLAKTRVSSLLKKQMR